MDLPRVWRTVRWTDVYAGLIATSLILAWVQQAHAQSDLQVSPSGPLLLDLEGEPTVFARLGQETQITTNLHNDGSSAQDAVLIVEIRDAREVTQGLQWREVSVPENSYVEVATTWTPEIAGSFHIRILVISDFESPEVLSPLVFSEVGASGFPLQIDKVMDFEDTEPEAIQRMKTSLGSLYVASMEPFQDIAYDSVTIDMERIGMQFHNGRDSYLLHTNATANVAGTGAHETYVMRFGYNEIDGIFEVQRGHHKKYIPGDVADRALNAAADEKIVGDFYSRFNSSGTIAGGVTYLDSFEVDDRKYMPDNGNQALRPGFEFLPDSHQVIVAFFSASTEGANGDQEGFGTIEMPEVSVYLDPADYKVLGASRLFWD